MRDNTSERLLQTHRLGEPLPHKIAIVRALPGLGDLMCAVPAWRALRAALPEAHVTLIGLPGARAFVERFHRYLDDLLELPGYPGLPERRPQIRQLPAFLAAAQERSFDLVLQMHGNGIITNPLTALLRARRSAGFYLPGQFCPDRERFLPYPSQEPEVRRHLQLMEFLGIPTQGDELEFPITQADERELRALKQVRRLRPGAYVCIHPGANHRGRRWPPNRFAAVADRLAGQGFKVVLTGTAKEAPLTQSVARAMRAKSIDLAGRTSLGALAALLSQARLLVCNDTGVSHLAAALRVPSVVIFTGSAKGGSNPIRWAPLNRELHHAVSPYSDSPLPFPIRPARPGPRGALHCAQDFAAGAGQEQGLGETRTFSAMGGAGTVERLGWASSQNTRLDYFGPLASHRCLRDACLVCANWTPDPPVRVSTEAVIAEVEDLLGKEARIRVV